jgi:hypothetical protein
MTEVRYRSRISQEEVRKITELRPREATTGAYFQLAIHLVRFHKAFSVVYMFGEYS